MAIALSREHFAYHEYRIEGCLDTHDVVFILACCAAGPSDRRIFVDARRAHVLEAALLELVEVLEASPNDRAIVAIVVGDLDFDARLITRAAPDGRRRHVRAFYDPAAACRWLDVDGS